MSIIAEKRRKTNSCFGYNERLLLEGYLTGRRGFEKTTKRKRLAEIFGCDRKTIYNEIKRGLVDHLRSDLSIVKEYNADYAQKKADYENTARGRDLKIGKDTHPDCLFTLTERKTRNEKAARMPNAKAESAVAYPDRLEREMGSEEFRKTFKTITCDGGSEFMDVKGLETSCMDGKLRTKVFFAHPYTACERGTNENHNRMLLRFFPKGCDFSKVTDKEVEDAVDWMNNYPGKIHKGLTSVMIYDKCCNF